MEPTSDSSTKGTEATWLVVTGISGKFICRTKSSRDDIMKTYGVGGVLTCEEVYDFACPMQAEQFQGGGMRIGKAQFASRIDATTCGMPVYISLMGALLYFLDDLKETDPQMYKHTIQDASDAARVIARERARRFSGIVTATQMPPGNGAFGQRS